MAGAMAEESRMEVGEAEASRDFSKRMFELIDEAQRRSGNMDMNTGEAMAYLAQHGHEEAATILAEFNSPEYQRGTKELYEAMKSHPDWAIVGDGHTFKRVGDSTEDDTPDKVLTWYRSQRHN